MFHYIIFSFAFFIFYFYINEPCTDFQDNVNKAQEKVDADKNKLEINKKFAYNNLQKNATP